MLLNTSRSLPLYLWPSPSFSSLTLSQYPSSKNHDHKTDPELVMRHAGFNWKPNILRGIARNLVLGTCLEVILAWRETEAIAGADWECLGAKILLALSCHSVPTSSEFFSTFTPLIFCRRLPYVNVLWTLCAIYLQQVIPYTAPCSACW